MKRSRIWAGSRSVWPAGLAEVRRAAIRCGPGVARASSIRVSKWASSAAQWALAMPAPRAMAAKSVPWLLAVAWPPVIS